MTEPTLTSVLHHLNCLVETGHERRQSDRQLLERFQQQREESAFAALVRRHGRLVLSAIRRVLRDEADVEDAFQATFLVLLRKASSVPWQASMGSWLFGVAHRIALKARANTLRRQRRESAAGRQRPLAGGEPVDLSWREALGLLHEELDRLPDKYRLPLLLCYLDGKGREEAARALGCTANAVKWRLERGRELLRCRLIRRGVTLSGALLAALVDAPSVRSVAPALVRSTLNAARMGTYRSSVAALMKAAAPTLWIGKTRLAVGVLLTVSLLAVGGGSVLAPPSVEPATQAVRPSERRQQLPAAADAKTKDIVIRGRVLDPDGKPVAGARLYSARVQNLWPRNDPVVALAQPEPTGADGRFHVVIKRPHHDELAYLVAHAAGFGVNWIDLSEDNGPQEVTLRLPKDVPIAGRVVNTEGRPVAGVSVSVAEIWSSTNDKLDDFLAGWLRDFRSNSIVSLPKRLPLPLDSILGKVTTDKDGRFTLHGAGSERIVHVAFFGAGVARSTPWIITRPEFDTKPYNAVIRRKENEYLPLNRFLGLFPPSFNFVAEAGKTIEGVVKDTVTGKPVTGCQVFTQTSYGHGIAAVSDAEGKYRIDGLAKRARSHYLSVRPPKDTAYLRRTIDVADTVGLATVRLDIELTKGAIVTGRVVDRQTGKPVRCYIRSVPLAGNKYYGSKPEFRRREADEALEAGEDGRFRLATIPGEVLLMARVLPNEKLNGQYLYVYRPAVPDPNHKEVFQRSGDTWRVTAAAGFLEFIDFDNAVKVVDVKEEGENRVEMFVDRGRTAQIVIQDGEGKALAGAWAAGLTATDRSAFKLPEAMATVYALNPDQPPKVPLLSSLVSALNPDRPRTLAFYHAEKKLGGTAEVRGDEKLPIAVKLAPLGQVSGRLLDGDGNPLEDAEVSFNPQGRVGRELYRYAAPTGKPIRTDKDGRFRIEGVVPGLKFGLGLSRQNTSLVGKPRIGVRQVKPGEALDLGDLRAKPAQ